MRKLLAFCLFSLSFGGEHPTSPTPPPTLDEDGDEMIALYECKGGILKLVWHAQELKDEELSKLKRWEGIPCKDI